MDIQLYPLAPELFLVSSAMAEDGAQYIEDEVGAHNILNKLKVELNKKTAYPLTVDHLSSSFFYLGAGAPKNITRQPEYFRFFLTQFVCLLAELISLCSMPVKPNKYFLLSLLDPGK